MALVWSGSMDGSRRVEVRSAGASLRLYVDGVLHTAWNARLGVTGAVWDPLAFAALLAPPGTVRRALLLGVGGGAAIHLLRRHVRPDRIVAVEREAVLVEVAKRWFGVTGPDLDLVTADAVEWVAARSRVGADGEGDAAPFDLVVDDLFHEACGEPVRSAGGASWWRLLATMTSAAGVLVVNFADLATFRRSALAADPWLLRRFPRAVRFACPGYTNAIVALRGPAAAGDALGTAAFRRRLRGVPTLSAAARRALRFRLLPVPR